MPEQPKPAQTPIIPGNFATVRVSSSAVWFDGGSFGMNLLEQRPTLVPCTVNMIQAMHEVGRFALTPAALVYLRRNIDAALEQYRRATGHEVPDPDSFGPTAAFEGLLSGPPPRDEPETT